MRPLEGTGSGGPGDFPGPGSVECPNCGSRTSGEYCAQCGQRLPGGRFTLRGILGQVVADGLNLERGLLATLRGLTIRPGRTVREYLSGRTRPYTNPVKYLLVFVALSGFATLGLGVMERQAEVLGAVAEDRTPQLDRYLELMTRYFNVALVAGVPFMAIFTRLLFRRAGFNIAEHLIFNIYVYGHQTALFLPFAAAMVIWPEAFAHWMGGYSLVMTAYYIWASERFFLVGRVRGALIASAVVALGLAAYALVVGLFVYWLAGFAT